MPGAMSFTERSADNTPVPLTEAQEGLWYAQRLDPANPIFNTGHCTDIRSPLNVELFLQAINLTLAEADALSLRMIDAPEGPQQVFDPGHQPTAELMDLRGDAQGPERAHQFMVQDLNTPLDPTRSPLARHVLFLLDDHHVQWYQRIHHLAADGYGMALIETRVVKVYNALLQGQADVGEPLASFRLVQQDDQQYRDAGKREQDRQFWLDTLSAAEPALSLTDQQALTDHRFLLARQAADPALIQTLQAAQSRWNLSWPDILTALTAAYVRRHTRQSACTVGVPYMGRLGNISARAVATVMNVAPLHLPIAEEPALEQFLIDSAKALRKARRHGRYRSEQLRRDLGLLGGMRRLHGPIINVLPFDAPYEQAGLDASQTVLCAGPVEDLNFTFRAQPDAGGMRLEVEANPKLYDQSQIQAHLQRLAHFLLAALRAERLLDVPTLSEAEHKHWIYTVNDTAHPVPATTLWALIEERLRTSPEQTGLVFQGQALSYADIDEQSARIATQLQSLEVGRGDIVAVALPRSFELVLSLLAILRAGAAYLPLDAQQPRARLAKIITAAQPRVLLGDPALELPINTVLPDRFHTAAAVEGPAAGPDDPAYIIYTSGSTGAPKGVLVNHDAIVNRLLWMRDHYGIQASDRILQKTPCTFDVSVWEFFLPFLSGACLVVAEPDAHKDPLQLARLIREQHISVLHFVPSMLAAFLDEPESHGLSPRLVFCSGEALPAAVRDRFHQQAQAELHNLYGPTEAAVDVSYWPASADDHSQPVPIGYPVWNTALYVLDEQLRPLPPGVPGHLYLAGRQLAQGYWGRPDLTAERFIPDPYPIHGERMYATGDIARWREDGALLFLGRSDHQIKLRGQRIELGEIEAVLARQPSVAHAAVIAREDTPGQLAIVAYAVARDGHDADADTVLQDMAGVLPEYMVPSALIWLDALPVSANGKLDRKALPAPAFQRQRQGRALDTQTEHTVARHMAQVLERQDALFADDDFFALGGHSLLAAKLALSLRTALGLPLSIGTIFEYPTLSRLAAHLDRIARDTHEEQAPDGFGPLITLRPALTGEPALFCIHPAGGLSWCYGTLSRELPAGRAVYGLQSRTLGSPHAQPEQSLQSMAQAYVDTLLGVQPEGPFHLAGWSVGGIIAQAMAQDLQARGHQVGVLAMLDAYPSDAWRDQPEPPANAVYKALLHIAGHDPDTLHDVALSREGVIGFLRRSGHPLGELPDAQLDGVFQVVEHNNRLVRQHRHQRYDGQALYFRAALDHVGENLYPSLWQPYVDSLDTHDIASLHAHLTGPEAVAVIAPVLAGHMAQADAAQPYTQPV